MKLIQKKCPSCGAEIKFDKNEKEVTCKYCNASFQVEKDLTDMVEDMIDPDMFKRHFKSVSYIGTAIMIIAIIVFLFIFLKMILM